MTSQISSVLLLFFLLLGTHARGAGQENVLWQLLGRWSLLVRQNVANGLEMRYLIRQQPFLSQQSLSMVATPFPESGVLLGANIDRVRRFSWRTQPESWVNLHYNSLQALYTVQQDAQQQQEIMPNGIPDVVELSNCLLCEPQPYLPRELRHVHSLPAVLDGVLRSGFTRSGLSHPDSIALFPSSIIHGGRLFNQLPLDSGLLRQARELGFRFGSWTFTNQQFVRPSLPVDRNQEPLSREALSMVHLGAAPHIASCSLFRWGDRAMLSTLNAQGRLVFVVSLELAFELGWISGECQPLQEYRAPDYWDDDSYGRQTNDFPRPTVIR